MGSGNIEVEGDKEDYYPGVDFKIIPRAQWKALPPTSTETLPLPAQRVFFMFTNTNRCESKKDCITAMQGLQKHYMDLGMPDLPYSFLVGGDLRVYEGRGWGVKISRTDMKGWSDERVIIAYICSQTQNDDRTRNMLRKGYQVMYYGVQNKYLVDFDNYDSKIVNVDDDKEVMKAYYEDMLKQEQSDIKRKDRREKRNKKSEEGNSKGTHDETKDNNSEKTTGTDKETKGTSEDKRKSLYNETKYTTEDVLSTESLNVETLKV